MIRFPMRRSLQTLAGGVLLASTALAPVAGAKAPPITDSVAVPMPPTPAGSAPGNLLGQPIAAADGSAQTVHTGTPVAKDWWLAFRSPAINGLVDRALTANADLSAAQARLAQAQALVGVARGALLPQLDAGLTSERQRLSRSLSTPLANPDPQVFSLHTAQVSVSYSPDLFGGGAARVRSAKAAAAVAAAQAEAMRSMVAANVVLAVIQNAALDAEIAANSDAIASNRQVLDLLRQREKLGAVGRSDVAAQEAALAAVEGTLPPLVRASAANQAALLILIGKAPGMPVFDSGGALPALEDLTLPADLPMALPADLLKTRPDVAAAAATLEGAAADVKVAMAARLPQLTLSATAGGTAEDFGRMFADGNPFWQLLGGLAAPIFHGGSLKRQQQAAEHALDAAKAGYRGTALQAFADVSNALTALSADATALSIAERGDAAASASFGFVKRQLQLGGVGTLQVLNASAVAQTARAQYVAAKAARLSDTVGLYVALGGGLQAPQGAAQPATPKP